MNDAYFKKLTGQKSKILGDAFRLSVRYGYDSKYLVESLMTNKLYYSVLVNDEATEWCDECFLLGVFDRIKPLKKGKTAGEFEMWFLGYLYKYWMRTRCTKPREIYKILPFERFMVMFDFYHTQDWDYIINDAIKAYREGRNII